MDEVGGGAGCVPYIHVPRGICLYPIVDIDKFTLVIIELQFSAKFEVQAYITNEAIKKKLWIGSFSNVMSRVRTAFSETIPSPALSLHPFNTSSPLPWNANAMQLSVYYSDFMDTAAIHPNRRNHISVRNLCKFPSCQPDVNHTQTQLTSTKRRRSFIKFPPPSPPRRG